MVKVGIVHDEWYPVRVLETEDVDMEYAVEFSQEFMDRYNKNMEEFDVIQKEICAKEPEE